jgi:hypothetical protein
LTLCFSQMVGKCSNYGSWCQETKFGNEICKEKGTNGYFISLRCKDYEKDSKNEPPVTDINKWYFYKNHIIGEALEKDLKRFFIFNEVDCQSQIFLTPKDFNARLMEEGLKPMIWTRWYEKNWGFFIPSGHILDNLNFAFLKVPALVIFGIVMLIGLMRTSFNLRHKFNLFNLFVVGLIIGRFLLDLFPDSI